MQQERSSKAPVIDWRNLSGRAGYGASRLPDDESDWQAGFLGTSVALESGLATLTGLRIMLNE